MHSFVGAIQNRSYVGQPTKNYKGIRKTNLISELLGAGSDPLQRDQSFSMLATNPRSLMNYKFVKPRNA